MTVSNLRKESLRRNSSSFDLPVLGFSFAFSSPAPCTIWSNQVSSNSCNGTTRQLLLAITQSRWTWLLPDMRNSWRNSTHSKGNGAMGLLKDSKLILLNRLRKSYKKRFSMYILHIRILSLSSCLEKEANISSTNSLIRLRKSINRFLNSKRKATKTWLIPFAASSPLKKKVDSTKLVISRIKEREFLEKKFHSFLLPSLLTLSGKTEKLKDSENSLDILSPCSWLSYSSWLLSQLFCSVSNILSK